MEAIRSKKHFRQYGRKLPVTPEGGHVYKDGDRFFGFKPDMKNCGVGNLLPTHELLISTENCFGDIM